MLSYSRVLCLLWIGLLASVAVCGAEEWGGETSDFHGFAQYDFSLDGLECKVVAPREAAAGKPWIWRARFFGHAPNVDIALLEKGFHVAFVDVSDLFGSPAAVARWDAFYAFLTQEKGFSKKPALEGLSRGGLILYNWASENPEKVACIYADAPVCDFKSWPGGKGKGAGNPKSWERCLAAYGFTEAEALAYKRNPLDRLEPLALAGVPLLHVVGDVDEVVPVAENTAVLEARYRELGGSIEVIHKPEVGHHPHGLSDPTPIVEFILSHR
ncbi:prolyl oligopeptidase family serine peptidase [Pelagicoccus sp. SDUM812005]|uniref:alpha/beta hydrolase family protein n=1 Tax=Pelagicoccus sp. SDUM812005 TaxID=3041257 RepID=UPI00280F4B4F|nr:prolyl oligopeptidase family serine peptidase [Pelagicoccus sp. SDUM812005]MDQ8183501.1 prolyl oligopeptidase family serine peptidase [Pelagicoccus sp. SDUM812005]